jgi:hypothetical protein
MGIARSFLAIAAGFVTMAVLVGLTTVIMQKTAPGFAGEEAKPRFNYMALNLVYSMAFAAAGGYVTTWLAPANGIVHCLMLALVVLVLSALTAMQMRGKQPVLYQLALTALTPLAVLCGGLGRLYQKGLRW